VPIATKTVNSISAEAITNAAAFFGVEGLLEKILATIEHFLLACFI
jgi:hypothetical protein